MNIEVSKSFQVATAKAVTSIVLFMVVYILLLLLAVGITILSVVAGFYLIIAKPMILTIGIGIGLASLGFFILIFLVKFIFKKHISDRSHLTEITEETQPQIFRFIGDIAKEVNTDSPKKIYLSADVNASVFYDSSFWSMFFPIKKNLQIGLGLINTTTEQEFKAVMAHEFGHFSQKSMKVGSYVYNVNQVIFNLLSDDDSFNRLTQKWANFSGYFSIFVWFAVKIIEAIQWILRKMYEYVNVNYLALSREMEFHADEVAANVAGSEALKESLLRMDLANHSFNSALTFYDNRVSDNIKSTNLYEEQLFVLNYIAVDSGLQFKSHLPLVSSLDSSKFSKSKLTISDQWASHPTDEERIAKLAALNIVVENPRPNPANALFANIDKLQQELTAKLFIPVENPQELACYTIDDFKAEYLKEVEKNSFNKIYNGYYDNKNPNKFDVHATEPTPTNDEADAYFNADKIDMVYEFNALENDLNTLLAIQDKQTNVKTFDYDGKKYSAKDTGPLIAQIEKEKERLSDEITSNDIAIYNHFYLLAHKQGLEKELISKYDLFFKNDEDFSRMSTLYYDLLNASDFVSRATPFDVIESNFIKLKILEHKFKDELAEMIKDEGYKAIITESARLSFEEYLKGKLTYFANNSYNEENLQILFKSIHEFSSLLTQRYFAVKRGLLEFQVQLMQSRDDSFSLKSTAQKIPGAIY